MLHLLVGPVYGHITENESKNQPSTRGNRTRDLSVTRGVLYRCATTAPSPCQKLLLALLKSSRAFIKFVSKYFLVILLFTVGPKTSLDFSSPGLMSPTLLAWASSNYKFKVRNHLCYGKSTLLVPCWQFLHSLPPTRVTLRKFEQMNVVGKKDEKPF